jgi:deoxyribodipyrimidine photo-lyase
MGRPFNEKYANVRWETDMKKYEAWKDGMTGFPIVDAVCQEFPRIADGSLQFMLYF